MSGTLNPQTLSPSESSLTEEVKLYKNATIALGIVAGVFLAIFITQIVLVARAYRRNSDNRRAGGVFGLHAGKNEGGKNTGSGRSTRVNNNDSPSGGGKGSNNVATNATDANANSTGGKKPPAKNGRGTSKNQSQREPSSGRQREGGGDEEEEEEDSAAMGSANPIISNKEETAAVNRDRRSRGVLDAFFAGLGGAVSSPDDSNNTNNNTNAGGGGGGDDGAAIVVVADSDTEMAPIYGEAPSGGGRTVAPTVAAAAPHTTSPQAWNPSTPATPGVRRKRNTAAAAESPGSPSDAAHLLAAVDASAFSPDTGVGVVGLGESQRAALRGGSNAIGRGAAATLRGSGGRRGSAGGPAALTVLHMDSIESDLRVSSIGEDDDGLRLPTTGTTGGGAAAGDAPYSPRSATVSPHPGGDAAPTMVGSSKAIVAGSGREGSASGASVVDRGATMLLGNSGSGGAVRPHVAGGGAGATAHSSPLQRPSDGFTATPHTTTSTTPAHGPATAPALARASLADARPTDEELLFDILNGGGDTSSSQQQQVRSSGGRVMRKVRVPRGMITLQNGVGHYARDSPEPSAAGVGGSSGRTSPSRIGSLVFAKLNHASADFHHSESAGFPAQSLRQHNNNVHNNSNSGRARMTKYVRVGADGGDDALSSHSNRPSLPASASIFAAHQHRRGVVNSGAGGGDGGGMATQSLDTLQSTLQSGSSRVRKRVSKRAIGVFGTQLPRAPLAGSDDDEDDVDNTNNDNDTGSRPFTSPGDHPLTGGELGSVFGRSLRGFADGLRRGSTAANIVRTSTANSSKREIFLQLQPRRSSVASLAPSRSSGGAAGRQTMITHNNDADLQSCGTDYTVSGVGVGGANSTAYLQSFVSGVNNVHPQNYASATNRGKGSLFAQQQQHPAGAAMGGVSRHMSIFAGIGDRTTSISLESRRPTLAAQQVSPNSPSSNPPMPPPTAAASAGGSQANGSSPNAAGGSSTVFNPLLAPHHSGGGVGLANANANVTDSAEWPSGVGAFSSTATVINSNTQTKMAQTAAAQMAALHYINAQRRGSVFTGDGTHTGSTRSNRGRGSSITVHTRNPFAAAAAAASSNSPASNRTASPQLRSQRSPSGKSVVPVGMVASTSTRRTGPSTNTNSTSNDNFGGGGGAVRVKKSVGVFVPPSHHHHHHHAMGGGPPHYHGELVGMPAGLQHPNAALQQHPNSGNSKGHNTSLGGGGGRDGDRLSQTVDTYWVGNDSSAGGGSAAVGSMDSHQPASDGVRPFTTPSSELHNSSALGARSSRATTNKTASSGGVVSSGSGGGAAIMVTRTGPGPQLLQFPQHQHPSTAGQEGGSLVETHHAPPTSGGSSSVGGDNRTPTRIVQQRSPPLSRSLLPPPYPPPSGAQAPLSPGAALHHHHGHGQRQTNNSANDSSDRGAGAEGEDNGGALIAFAVRRTDSSQPAAPDSVRVVKMNTLEDDTGPTSINTEASQTATTLRGGASGGGPDNNSTFHSAPPANVSMRVALTTAQKQMLQLQTKPSAAAVQFVASFGGGGGGSPTQSLQSGGGFGASMNSVQRIGSCSASNIEFGHPSRMAVAATTATTVSKPAALHRKEAGGDGVMGGSSSKTQQQGGGSLGSFDPAALAQLSSEGESGAFVPLPSGGGSIDKAAAQQLDGNAVGDDDEDYEEEEEEEEEADLDDPMTVLDNIMDDRSKRVLWQLVEKRWQRGRMLGSGGSGAVYQCIMGDGSFVAMKTIPTGDSDDSTINVMINELLIMANLRCPYIIRYYHGEIDDDTHEMNIWMEYVSGGTLADLAVGIVHDEKASNPNPSGNNGFSKMVVTNRVRKALHEDIGRRYIKQILEAISYLHSCGVVHRDIKGENVLLDWLGTVKLADFGIARATKPLGGDGGDGGKARQQLKQLKLTTHIQGTPTHMAPEVVMPSLIPHHDDPPASFASGMLASMSSFSQQAGSQASSPHQQPHHHHRNVYEYARDVWALGMTCVEILNMGELCYDHLNFKFPYEVLTHIAQLKQSPPLPATLLATASPRCVDFIRQCLVLDVTRRPTAQQLLQHPWMQDDLYDMLDNGEVIEVDVDDDEEEGEETADAEEEEGDHLLQRLGSGVTSPYGPVGMADAMSSGPFSPPVTPTMGPRAQPPTAAAAASGNPTATAAAPSTATGKGALSPRFPPSGPQQRGATAGGGGGANNNTNNSKQHYKNMDVRENLTQVATKFQNAELGRQQLKASSSSRTMQPPPTTAEAAKTVITVPRALAVGGAGVLNTGSPAPPPPNTASSQQGTTTLTAAALKEASAAGTHPFDLCVANAANPHFDFGFNPFDDDSPLPINSGDACGKTDGNAKSSADPAHRANNAAHSHLSANKATPLSTGNQLLGAGGPLLGNTAGADTLAFSTGTAIFPSVASHTMNVGIGDVATAAAGGGTLFSTNHTSATPFGAPNTTYEGSAYTPRTPFHHGRTDTGFSEKSGLSVASGPNCAVLEGTMEGLGRQPPNHHPSAIGGGAMAGATTAAQQQRQQLNSHLNAMRFVEMVSSCSGSDDDGADAAARLGADDDAHTTTDPSVLKISQKSCITNASASGNTGSMRKSSATSKYLSTNMMFLRDEVQQRKLALAQRGDDPQHLLVLPTLSTGTPFSHAQTSEDALLGPMAPVVGAAIHGDYACDDDVAVAFPQVEGEGAPPPPSLPMFLASIPHPAAAAAPYRAPAQNTGGGGPRDDGFGGRELAKALPSGPLRVGIRKVPLNGPPLQQGSEVPSTNPPPVGGQPQAGGAVDGAFPSDEIGTGRPARGTLAASANDAYQNANDVPQHNNRNAYISAGEPQRNTNTFDTIGSGGFAAVGHPTRRGPAHSYANTTAGGARQRDCSIARSHEAFPTYERITEIVREGVRGIGAEAFGIRPRGLGTLFDKNTHPLPAAAEGLATAENDGPKPSSTPEPPPVQLLLPPTMGSYDFLCDVPPLEAPSAAAVAPPNGRGDTGPLLMARGEHIITQLPLTAIPADSSASADGGSTQGRCAGGGGEDVLTCNPSSVNHSTSLASPMLPADLDSVSTASAVASGSGARFINELAPVSGVVPAAPPYVLSLPVEGSNPHEFFDVAPLALGETAFGGW